MQAKLVIEEKALDARVIAEKGLKVFSPDRLRILESLAEKPKYPAQVAKELKMHLQTAYYHFNLLEKAGIISRGATEEKRGALAKKFVFDADALAIIVRDRWKPFSEKKKVFAIAGSDHNATRVGILALLKKRKELEKGNDFDAGIFAKIAQGFDEDGDGI